MLCMVADLLEKEACLVQRRQDAACRRVLAWNNPIFKADMHVMKTDLCPVACRS
jgi:hypothetical protein